ncbi:MAG TPA: TIGR03000 domain-containing protein [Gemmataceae bacterium]|jgi:uncharacterized protein (TIGR03000 family)|nr:TIGR03000 domain-containing protein [Gemmataceae bacterium]
MYSIVLAAALSVNTTAPDFGGLFRRDRLACYGGCMGCYGCAGCYGVVDCGCATSYGAGWGTPMTHMEGGAMPDFGVYGAPQPMLPPMAGPSFGEGGAPPTIPSIPNIPGESPAPPLAGAAGGYSVPPNAALIVVTMPPDGKLLANGKPIEGTGSVRVFQTPPLEPGKEYDYEIQISLDRGGKKYEPKEVTKKFRAGERVNVEFGEPGPMGGTSARFTINMPPKSSLTVEGKPVSLADGSSFRTPPLESGRTYYYTLELEVWRGGQRETLSRNVAFRAGESVKVDFAAAGGR